MTHDPTVPTVYCRCDDCRKHRRLGLSQVLTKIAKAHERRPRSTRSRALAAEYRSAAARAAGGTP